MLWLWVRVGWGALMSSGANLHWSIAPCRSPSQGAVELHPVSPLAGWSCVFENKARLSFYQKFHCAFNWGDNRPLLKEKEIIQ